MPRTLLLFIQSGNPNPYINVISHCVHREEVRDIYFLADKKSLGEKYEDLETISKIRKGLGDLVSAGHAEYVKPLDFLPTPSEAEDRIIRLAFGRPEDALPELKQRFTDVENLMVDVTGCEKRVATDVIASYMAGGLNHVRHFALADKVYSPEWKAKHGLLYHDLRDGDVTYYEYDDFSTSGTTIATFRYLRSQGRLVKVLMGLTLLLAIAVFVLITLQNTAGALVVTVLTAAAAGLSLSSDSFALLDRFKS